MKHGKESQSRSQHFASSLMKVVTKKISGVQIFSLIIDWQYINEIACLVKLLGSQNYLCFLKKSAYLRELRCLAKFLEKKITAFK